MAESASCSVGTEDISVNMDEEIVQDMSTVGAMTNVTTEIVHIPANKFVYLISNSGNELSFVSGKSGVTSSSGIQGPSQLSGAHCSGSHVVNQSHMAAQRDQMRLPSWRDAASEQGNQLHRSTLEMEVAATKQMLSQQQVALTSLAETMKSIQSEIRDKNDSASTSGVNKRVAKTKVDRLQDIYEEVSSDSDFSCDSDEEGSEDEQHEQPPTKVSKLRGSENESTSKLSKLDCLFSAQEDQGPKVHESLAKSINRGISNNFSLKAGLELGEKFKSPENCEFLSVPKLNEELFFEESINTKYKKNDGVLQKTQLLLTKGMVPLVLLMDKLLLKTDSEDRELFDLATDSLQLLAYTHRDMSNVRRKFLKPAVASKYKRLCASHIPLSSQLFGDDLDKQLKSINERKRIGVQMTNDFTRKRTHGSGDHYNQPSSSQRSSYGGKGSSKPFLYKQKGNNPKYKKGKGYNSQNHNNNKNR